MINPNRNPDDFPCDHRGPEKYRQMSALCGSCNETAQVFGCQVFGLCTSHNFGIRDANGERLKICLSCDTRKSLAMPMVPA